MDKMETERRKSSTSPFLYMLMLQDATSGKTEHVLALNSPHLVQDTKSPQLIQRQCKCENGKRMRDEFPHSCQPQKCIAVNFSLKKKDILYFLNYKNHNSGLT